MSNDKNIVPSGAEAQTDYANQSALGRAQLLQQFSESTAQNNAIRNDTMSVRMANLLASMAGLTPVNELLKSPSQMDQTIGHLGVTTAAALMGKIHGVGDPSALYSGIRHSVLSGGMNIQNSDTGTISPIPMYGPTSAALSAQLFRRVSDHYFPDNGMPDLQRTRGLDRNDIGEVYGELTRRGAFGGITMAEQRTITPDYIDEQRTLAIAGGSKQADMDRVNALAVGDIAINLRDDVPDKVAKIGNDAVRAVGWLKKILGNVPAGQLIADAESLTGYTFGEEGGAAKIQTRMAQSLATGRKYGFKDIGMANFNAATTATLDRVMSDQTGQMPGSYEKFSARVSGMVDRVALDSVAQQQKIKQDFGDSMNIPTPTPQDAAAMTASSMAKILSQEKELVTAGYALSNMPMTEANRKALQNQISSFGSVGSPAERQQWVRQTNSLLSQAGVNAEGTVAALGLPTMMAGMTDGIQQTIAEGALNGDQARNQNLYRHSMSRMLSGTAKSWLPGGSITAAADLASDLNAIPASHTSKFMTALRDNMGGSGLQQALESSLGGASMGMGISAADIARRVSSAQNSMPSGAFGGQGMAGFMEMKENFIGHNPLLSNLQRGALDTSLDQEKLPMIVGEYEPASDMFGNLIHGLMGGKATIEAHDYARWAEDQGNSKDIMVDVGINEDGSMKLDDDKQYSKLKKVVDWSRRNKKLDLFNHMGIKGDTEADRLAALDEKLRQKGGAKGLLDMQPGNENILLDPNSDGSGFRIMDPKIREGLDSLKVPQPVLDQIPSSISGSSTGGTSGASASGQTSSVGTADGVKGEADQKVLKVELVKDSTRRPANSPYHSVE